MVWLRSGQPCPPPDVSPGPLDPWTDSVISRQAAESRVAKSHVAGTRGAACGSREYGGRGGAVPCPAAWTQPAPDHRPHIGSMFLAAPRRIHRLLLSIQPPPRTPGPSPRRIAIPRGHTARGRTRGRATYPGGARASGTGPPPPAAAVPSTLPRTGGRIGAGARESRQRASLGGSRPSPDPRQREEPAAAAGARARSGHSSPLFSGSRVPAPRVAAARGRLRERDAERRAGLAAGADIRV